MLKKCTVVKLSTNQKAEFYIKDHMRLFNNRIVLNGYFQELYVVSDEGIKEGDWCIDIEDNILFQVKEQGYSGLLKSDTDKLYQGESRESKRKISS